MSNLRWSLIGDILSLNVGNNKPVIVRGDEAQQLAQSIRKLGDRISDNDALDIYEKAINSSSANTNSDLFSISDKEVVLSMQNGGVSNVDYKDNRVMLGGRLVRGAVSRHIRNIIVDHNADLDSIDWQPIANFFARMDSNPTAGEEMFKWLSINDFSTASDGRVICYKGVDSNYESRVAGMGGWIDAEANGFHLPDKDPKAYLSKKKLVYAPGNTVIMRRSDVDPNSEQHCSTGIHFGTKFYARGYSSYGGRMMMCLVAPEDIVAIPSDNFHKARACRLEVVAEIDIDDDLLVKPVVEFVHDDNETISLYDATREDKPQIPFNFQ